MTIRKTAIAALAAGTAMTSFATPAHAQAEPYIAQMMVFGGNFCPRGWASASGQIVSIAQNTALFSLLGTTYGGDGQTTFALPNLQGRSAVAQGQGPGLSNYSLGELGGAETVTLLTTQMPAHTHATVVDSNIMTSTQAPNTNNPNGGSLATFPVGRNVYFNGPGDQTGMAGRGTATIAATGGNQPHENRAPYLAMTWCIAIEGIFPPRN